MSTEQSNQKRDRSKTIIIILSVIIVLQAIKIFSDFQVRETLETTTTDLTETRTRLEEIKTELDQKIAEISKLGGDIQSLQQAKAEVEATLKKNKAWSQKNIKSLKDQVQGYEKLLKMKDEELDHLKSLNQALYSENNSLKSNQNKLSDSINRITRRTSELANKVAVASQLKAENIRVLAINGSNREKEPPFRNRQLEKLKLTFNLADNKVAPIEGKKIMFRLLDENGQVIFDLAKGSGTFTLKGRETWYTAMQDILFDNTHQQLTFLYEKGSDYVSGNYTAEIYDGEDLIGTTNFTVR
jgi:predicted  nucleic acid-binding Zn-ribbon protein